MTVYYVTRHQGAIDWLTTQDGVPAADEIVDDFHADCVKPGDIVIGSLPVHIAAQVCTKGGRYLHLVLATPSERRGQELTSEEMETLGTRLEEYRVEKKHE